MASRLNPYIQFRDTAREAMTFYQQVFGGTLVLNTFGDFGSTGPERDLIMHGMLETPAGFTLMGADTPPGMDRSDSTYITISLSGDDGEALRGYWDQLSADGKVVMPLERQVWGDEFGECADRFGVSWLVNIAGATG